MVATLPNPRRRYMIAFISGVLRARGTDWVQLEVSGIGYHISVPASLALSVGEEGQRVTLHTRLMIRDDEPQLYGFPNPQALKFFEMLLGVSGIGPRSALNLLSVRTPDVLASAIMGGDLDAFTSVSGIGKRIATRIVIELKDRLEKEGLPLPDAGAAADADAVAALTALGYTAGEVRQALRSLGPDAASLEFEERIRRALTHLAQEG